ncbi:MAG: alpha/beta hydrolase [Erythrobacter sp.]|uniref:alpha/beta hydrolase n=1 Tax=Erythrobacter sp. TaxID=1042 RepID=UPI00261A8DF4|nr:alpha/beta hydrolase [Erythrobacter sp.]MDJ0978553.1 alpha/beta hydrolase [Erythrobacter sp.]
MILWTLGSFVIVFAFGGVALQLAIARNGPAVLNAVDYLTGNTRGVIRLARISTGDHPAQKLIVWGPSDAVVDPDSHPDPGPNANMGLPVLLFAHGGSWRSGDPEDYGFIARAFVPQGFVVVLAGYRLVKDGGSDGAYPAMIEDTARAIGWTRETIARYGGDPDRIVVMGHSAGAYNVVMSALDCRWLDELGANALRGVIGLSGPYDFYPFDSESTIAAFGNAPDPEATQVFNHVRADAAPALLIHGEKDTLVRPRNSRELAALIETAGGAATLRLFPDMNHNDPLISLASPWRKRRDLAATISAFAGNAARSPRA